MTDSINHPEHYNQHPAGYEAIDIAEAYGFNLGNVIKYVMRAEHKGNQIQDLKKAAWYLNREIERLGKPILFSSNSLIATEE